ncbi:ankyrin-3 [Caerostris extrusa]|uniref:Ankyrin-3 n=1 Tax=Caerostris extrusa TaxID=172846 RepID=A0AAV4TUL5_CAEEX|nr:ankyrin-3 [Caerostris extrusa]
MLVLKLTNKTLLHLSAVIGSLQMTKYFVDYGADIHAKDSTDCKPVHVAAAGGFKDILELLFGRWYSRHCDHLTLLHIAAQTGKSNVCELLIEKSADINAVSIFGSTPLHLATGNGFKDIVGILLHNGAFYNALDGYKFTPFQRSKENSISKLLNIVEELFRSVERNVDSLFEKEIEEAGKHSSYCFANAKCVKNETLLHFATKKGCEEIVDILLKYGVNQMLVILINVLL